MRNQGSHAADFAILRSDGRWYMGTVDREPIFGAIASDNPPATFSEAAGERRLEGLERAEGPFTFELIPVTL